MEELLLAVELLHRALKLPPLPNDARLTVRVAIATYIKLVDAMHKWDALKRISVVDDAAAAAARPSVTPQLQAMVFHEAAAMMELPQACLLRAWFATYNFDARGLKRHVPAEKQLAELNRTLAFVERDMDGVARALARCERAEQTVVSLALHNALIEKCVRAIAAQAEDRRRFWTVPLQLREPPSI